MKRHLVLDLYFSNYTEEDGPWHKIDEDGYPKSEKSIKVKVKLAQGTELFAYYHPDKMEWARAQHEPSYFWSCSSRLPLYHVREWKLLKRPD